MSFEVTYSYMGTFPRVSVFLFLERTTMSVIPLTNPISREMMKIPPASIHGVLEHSVVDVFAILGSSVHSVVAELKVQNITCSYNKQLQQTVTGNCLDWYFAMCDKQLFLLYL